MEVLGEIVFPYDSVYKFEKGRKHIHPVVYNAIHISLFVSEFKIFSLLSLLEHVLHHHGTCSTSYLYYLLVPYVETKDDIHFEYCMLTWPFCQL